MSDVSLASLLEAEAKVLASYNSAKAAAEAAGRAIRSEGKRQLLAELAARGVSIGGNVIVDGAVSGAWGDQVRRLKHDRTPVFLRSVSVDSRPPGSTCDQWWFRVTIARLRKDGTPRDEWRNLLIHGIQPADAAMMLEAAE
jgi:hypothetical protein